MFLAIKCRASFENKKDGAKPSREVARACKVLETDRCRDELNYTAKNLGLRTIAKLFQNFLCYKFGQRDDLSTTEFIDGEHAIRFHGHMDSAQELITEPQVFLGSNHVLLSYLMQDVCVPKSFISIF